MNKERHPLSARDLETMISLGYKLFYREQRVVAIFYDTYSKRANLIDISYVSEIPDLNIVKKRVKLQSLNLKK